MRPRRDYLVGLLVIFAMVIALSAPALFAKFLMELKDFAMVWMKVCMTFILADLAKLPPHWRLPLSTLYFVGLFYLLISMSKHSLITMFGFARDVTIKVLEKIIELRQGPQSGPSDDKCATSGDSEKSS